MSVTTAPGLATPTAQATSTVDYDSRSNEAYAAKWVAPMGLGEMVIHDTRNVMADGVFSLSAVPFQTALDAVFDHARYFAVSHEVFAMPESGSLQFSVDVVATTPGTQPRRVSHGSYPGTPDGRPSYAQSVTEGQQAAVTFNMTNVETNQLFDWFVSGNEAFALIERLPGNVTNPALPASDPGYVGLDRAYTQMIKSAPIAPGDTHSYAIRSTRSATQSSVEHFWTGNCSPASTTSGSRSTRIGSPPPLFHATSTRSTP